MEQKLIKAIMIIFTGVALFGLGAWAGGKTAVKNVQAQEQRIAERSTSDRIVIVNLDEGTMINDERIIYASQLLSDLPENFSFTGLEDAKLGCSNGVYAAYLVVPATFSQSIVSLNTVPVKTQVQYAIQDNLAENTKEKVIHDVVGLIGELNNRVEYMYLHSVLDEVHEVQDYANTIMENDQTDAQVIADIQANDLIEAIPITPLSEIDNNIEPVDISEYMMRNGEYTQEVGEKYTEFLSLSMEEQLKILEDSKELMGEMENMELLLSSMDFFNEMESEQIIQEGYGEIDAIFAVHNEKLAKVEGEVRKDLNTVSGNMLFLEDSVAQYDQKISEQHADIAAYLAEEILKQYEKKDSETDEGDGYETGGNGTEEDETGGNKTKEDETGGSKTEEDGTDGDGTGGDGTGGDGTENGSNPGSKIGNGDETGTNESGTGTAKDSFADHEYTVTNVPASSRSAETELGAIPLKSRKSSSRIQQKTIENSWQLFTGETGAGESGDGDAAADKAREELTALIQEYLEQQYTGFGNYIYAVEEKTDEEAGENENGEEGDNGDPATEIPYWSGTISELLKAEWQRVEQKLSQESAINVEPLAVKDVETIVTEKVVTPIDDLVTETRTAMLAQYEIEKGKLNVYQEAVTEYDPLSYIKEDEIDKLKSAMYDNGDLLSEAIFDTSMQQEEYVASVYESSREDLLTMQDTIQAAKEESDLLVTEGLARAQEVKAQNSAVNQMLLKDFAQILPYTRLGSMEYQQAYEFIVNPVESNNINEISNNIKPKNQTVKTADQGVKITEDKGLTGTQMAVIALGILTILCLLLVSRYFILNKQKDNNVLE